MIEPDRLAPRPPQPTTQSGYQKDVHIFWNDDLLPLHKFPPGSGVLTPKLQLVVHYLSGQTRFYPIKESWKIDTINRVLTEGIGIPRIMIPFDTVASFAIEEVDSDAGTIDPKDHS